ncbi:HIT family protein [Streptomyces sp. NPDC048603]|uniref:HIT family protein n=1 Tax=Streptomyces sp. NPDC048603 TaxID=3365577 RepID=UPI0037216C15
MSADPSAGTSAGTGTGPGESSCLACALTAGTAPLPGGTLLRTPHWVVEHCVGPLGLGTVVVKPVRHVLHVARLTPEESAELGPLLQRVSDAVTEVTAPQQVYVCLRSHAGAVPGHIHFVVQPARARDLAEHDAYGPALQMAMFRAGRRPAEAEVAAVCDRLRAALDSPAPRPLG